MELIAQIALIIDLDLALLFSKLIGWTYVGVRVRVAPVFTF